jgi:hypothetical protein
MARWFYRSSPFAKLLPSYLITQPKAVPNLLDQMYFVLMAEVFFSSRGQNNMIPLQKGYHKIFSKNLRFPTSHQIAFGK